MATHLRLRLLPLVPAIVVWLLLTACSASAAAQLNPAPAQRQASGIMARLQSAIVASQRRAAPSVSAGALVQQCPQEIRGACFTPAQLRAAYNIEPLAAQGIDGSGQTVIVTVSYGSPTLEKDVAAYSQATGLPPADVQQLFPLGTDFEADSGCADQAGWASETTLDVELIHAIAPGARIIVLASPVAETEGAHGLPEMLALEQYVRDNHLGSIINQSWGTSESLLTDPAGQAARAAFDAFYADATQSDLTVISASGDAGLLGDTLECGPSDQIDPGWPAASPWVTSVGGTMLTLNADGSYASEKPLQAGSFAGGAGVSTVYPAPAEESLIAESTRTAFNGMRAEPDVSAVGAGLLVYYSGPTRSQPVARAEGGTSASAPIWAGIAALAAQMAGGPLGNINPELYAIGASGRCFHDVTSGSNRFRANPGVEAVPGWDLATGWGTPDAACLVPALADAVRSR